MKNINLNLHSMKLHLTLVLVLLSTFISICFAQENSISQAEYDALRSLDSKIPVYDSSKLHDAIKRITNKVEQELFPDGTTHFNIDIEFYTDQLQGGHKFIVSVEDYNLGLRVAYAHFMPAKAQMMKDAMKEHIEKYTKDSGGGFPISFCGYRGAFANDRHAMKYYDYNNDFNIVVETISGDPDIEAFGNKMCTSFEKHGLHNLTEYLLSLPVYEKQEEVIPEPIQDNIEDPISINIVLKDKDNQFTLADEAILNVVIKNQSDEKLENLVFEIEVIKDKVTLQVQDRVIKPSQKTYYEEKNILFWEPAISLKTENEGIKHLGFPSVMSNTPFTLSSKDQIEYSLIIKSAPEDNAWIYRYLINDNTKPLDTESLYAKISDLLKVKIKSSKGVILYDNQPPVLSNGEEAKLTYPKFGIPSTKIIDKEHLDFYLKGDEEQFSFFDDGNLRILACKAARYNRSDHQAKNGQWFTRYPAYITIPEEEYKVIENMAQYVYDVFTPKSWPEPIDRPNVLAKSILEGEFGLGKTVSDEWWGTKKVRATLSESNYFKWDILNKDDKTGIACIEHAFFFNNLTRILGFPTREITCMSFLIPWKGFQDASSEVFYLNPVSGRYEWTYYSLYNYEGKPITDPYKRYGNQWGYFYLWRGVSATGVEASAIKNRFTMKTDELNNSALWEFHAVGYVGEIDYNIKFEDAQKPSSSIKIEAHSPLTKN